MYWLLRIIILIMFLSIVTTILSGHHVINLDLGHMLLAISSYLFLIFAQAFTMFYFIGIHRLVENVFLKISSNDPTQLREIFAEEIPLDLKSYVSEVKGLLYKTNLCKRKTIPWTMLMIILGMAAFLLGGAFDTQMVERHVHSGVAYGFFASMLIGFVKQWHYLGEANKNLRKLKALFMIPDHQM